MKRTISAEVGKGSINHNSRKFRAENVDGSRTHLNNDYCNERIQTVYHQLFYEALKRYNEKQTRSDRRIPNYYEKIRSGNQEKPFHEIILQIGNKEDMSATGEYAELAQTVLDKYYQGFQERNPNLRVFSAHLHMDEATPHIHIDFVPFTTGSKRGLDTRVSLKQALAVQGFKGGTRGATEWAQWVQSEKEQLAAVMERYDIQWEQKGTHEKHLSVLDYKKQEREKEIAALDSTLAEKQDELETVQNRIDNFDQGAQSIERLEQRIESDAEFQLPDPPTLMTAKTYKQRFVDPLIKKLKEVIREVFYHYYKALDSYHRLNTTNGRLYRENEHLTAANDRLKGENDALRSELKDFRFLRKVLGSQQIDTGVLLCHSNGSHIFDFKCDKIVACLGCNDPLQYRLELFRCIGHLSEQKIHISRNTAIEIREGIEEQAAFENKVFRIFRLFQTAQELFLAEKLQAELIASAAFCRFVFEPCKHGCSYVSHSAAPPSHSSFSYKRPFPLRIWKGWQGFSFHPPHKH